MVVFEFFVARNCGVSGKILILDMFMSNGTY